MLNRLNFKLDSVNLLTYKKKLFIKIWIFFLTENRTVRIINCKVEPMTAIIRAYESPSSSSDIRNRRQSPRRLGWHLIAGGLAGTYCVESKANERKACRPREGRGIEWDFGSWHYPTDMTWYMHRHWTEFGTRTSPKSLPGPLPPRAPTLVNRSATCGPWRTPAICYLLPRG